MRVVRQILKLIALGLLGYLLIALGQILFLEVLLKGQTAPDSPSQVLALAALGTILSGLIGGYLAARLGGDQPLRHTLAVLVFLSLDGIYVIVENVGGHPLWYELSGLATLMLATAVGRWLRKVQRDRDGHHRGVAADAIGVGDRGD